MISIDTGPARAAAALCLPLVVLYGVQSARVWLPRSGGHSPVWALEARHVSEISAAQVIERWRALPPAADPATRGCDDGQA
jgi:ADP-heptose:LPS heptosyltransferase